MDLSGTVNQSTGNIPQYTIERNGKTDVDVVKDLARLNGYENNFYCCDHPPTMSNGNKGVMMVVAGARRTLLVDLKVPGRSRLIENMFWDGTDFKVTEYENGRFLIELDSPELIRESTISQIPN
jgi:hypothetical protein